jgi:hypothetical protein
MLLRLRKRRAARRDSRLRAIPIDFVISYEQYCSLFIMSDFELAEEYVANSYLSGMAKQELARRYAQYDATANWFIDDVAALIHVGEVS